jgi:hypothetical protein
MTNPYKLNEEIEHFIIAKKRLDPKLSCRSLIPLVKERFNVALSKSLINNVIKTSNLSSPKGRQKLGEPEAPLGQSIESIKPPAEQIIYQEVEVIKNGGFFFLRAANLKLSLTHILAQALAGYFPETTQRSLQGIIEALIYLPFFRDKDIRNLSLLVGREISLDSLESYLKKLGQIAIPELKDTLTKANLYLNFSDINNLCKECLLQLNAYVQEVFFPKEYKSLSLTDMSERFYSLMARIEKKPRVLKIRLLYPPGFSYANDIVWQEGFGYAAYKVNAAAVFTKESEQIWMSSLPELFI